MYQLVDQYHLNGPGNKCFKKTGEGNGPYGLGEGHEAFSEGKASFLSLQDVVQNQAFHHSQDKDVYRVEAMPCGT